MQWAYALLLPLVILFYFWIVGFLETVTQRSSWRWILWFVLLGWVLNDRRWLLLDEVLWVFGLLLAVLLSDAAGRLGKAAGRRVARRQREQVSER